MPVRPQGFFPVFYVFLVLRVLHLTFLIVFLVLHVFFVFMALFRDICIYYRQDRTTRRLGMLPSPTVFEPSEASTGNPIARQPRDAASSSSPLRRFLSCTSPAQVRHGSVGLFVHSQRPPTAELRRAGMGELLPEAVDFFFSFWSDSSSHMIWVCCSCKR